MIFETRHVTRGRRRLTAMALPLVDVVATGTPVPPWVARLQKAVTTDRFQYTVAWEVETAWRRGEGPRAVSSATSTWDLAADAVCSSPALLQKAEMDVFREKLCAAVNEEVREYLEVLYEVMWAPASGPGFFVALPPVGPSDEEPARSAAVRGVVGYACENLDALHPVRWAVVHTHFPRLFSAMDLGIIVPAQNPGPVLEALRGGQVALPRDADIRAVLAALEAAAL